MKKIFHILTAALLLTGCANDDTPIDNNTAKTVTFTATLAPKGGATTRAITVNNQGTTNETLTTAWKNNEKVAVYYQTGTEPVTYAKTEATVGTPNADGSAPITATLTGAIDGGTVKFVYPAYLMKNDGTIYWSRIRINQQGYLTTPETGSGSGQGQSAVNPSSVATISNNFDLATAMGTISVTGSEASVSGPVTMANECCICKFNILLPLSDQVSTVTHYDIAIAFDGGETYTLKEIPKDRLNELYVAMRPVSSAQATITAKGYISSGGSVSLADPTILSTHSKVINSVTLVAGKFYRNVPVTLQKGIFIYLNGNVQFSNSDELLLVDGAVVAGVGGANTQLKIADGATVTLNGLTNTGITQDANIPGIECLGDATIILAGENSITGREFAPGIFVPYGHTLTIKGSGTLIATGGNTNKTGSSSGLIGGAGIGGTKDVSCGNIVIAGGTITATGTGQCAGIGSGKASNANITCGNITISGGTVTATGGMYAAGIGSGWASNANITCGNITISGGTVTATGGKYAAAIGSGNTDFASNTCGAIAISGGTVTATGGSKAAGIGSGNGHNDDNNIYVSACGAISITGGTVTATSGDGAAGIGGGREGRFASISIGSGITRVTATRINNSFNVPIGKVFYDRGSGAVTFDDVTMHNGNGDGWNSSKWAHWPETGGPFGGIQVSASDYGSNDGRTWTLTPAPGQ